VVSTSQHLLVVPGDEKAVAKRILVNSEPVSMALAGDHVDIELSAIKASALKAGDILCDPQKRIRAVRKFQARILTFDASRSILLGTYCSLHQGRLDVSAVIQRLVSLLDRNTGQITKNKPRRIPPGQGGIVEILLGEAIPLETFQESRQLGRFILRGDGETIAAGVVLSILTE
jgi:elongation factor 1 alpha-like protein